MNHGGEASDQVVRIMLEGTEIAMKLTGSATKNVAAALYAMYKDNKKLKKGQCSLAEILKEGKETRIFRMDTKDLAEFKRQAKKFGVRYAAVKETGSKENICDVIIKSQDIPRVNHVLKKMDYVTMSPPEALKENIDPKKENQQRNSSNTQKNKSEQSSKAKANTNDLESQLNDYSPRNKERILEQFPSASVVMSKTKWREMGRYPKQGAKGIVITMPEHKDGNRTGQFVDVKVYDVSETYGREIGKANVKSKGKPSVVAELKEHRKAVDNGAFTAKKADVKRSDIPMKPKDKGK